MNNFLNSFSVSKERKQYLNNFLIFGFFFIAITLNMCLVPSIINSKSYNIAGLMNLFSGNKQVQQQCDSKCANNCLFSDSKSTEHAFKQCLSSCHCEYIATPTDFSFVKLYFLFCLAFSLLVAIYLKFQQLKYAIMKKYSFMPLRRLLLRNIEIEQYEKLLSNDN